MRLKFEQYNDRIHELFDETKFNSLTALCSDVARGIYKKFTVDEANQKIRQAIFDITGLNKDSKQKDINRAFRNPMISTAVFEILEDTIEDTLVTEWGADPFFKKYVELKTMALGQTNIFYTKDKSIVTISEIADGHHNIERQRLKAGSSRAVTVKSYGAKVYMEMSRFIQGVEDWAELVGKISEAFTRYINTELHDNVMSAATSLPVSTKWNLRGLCNPTNKPRFKRLISDVKMATGASSVNIMGTDVALSELTGFGSVSWSDEAKSDFYRIGRLGSFEGTPLVEIPQAFAYNDVENYLEADDKLLIMPNNIDKFIKMYYEGADETRELPSTMENADDTKEYEFKTRFGIMTMTNTRFGLWTIGA